MSVEENIKLDEQGVAAWNAHDADKAVAIMSDDVVWHDLGSPEPLQGKEAARAHIQGQFAAFPDLKITVKNRVATEDQVATELEFSGTNTGPLPMAPGMPPIPATGKQVSVKGVYFLRIRDGQIVELHTYPDAAGMMMQLGLMPGAQG